MEELGTFFFLKAPSCGKGGGCVAGERGEDYGGGHGEWEVGFMVFFVWDGGGISGRCSEWEAWAGHFVVLSCV